MKPLGWAFVGLAGAMTVLASTFGGLAVNSKRKVESADDGVSWRSDLLSYYRNYPKYKAATWACAGVGAAALAAGTVLLVLDKKAARKERVAVLPMVHGSGGGLSLGGRF